MPSPDELINLPLFVYISWYHVTPLSINQTMFETSWQRLVSSPSTIPSVDYAMATMTARGFCFDKNWRHSYSPAITVTTTWNRSLAASELELSEAESRISVSKTTSNKYMSSYLVHIILSLSYDEVLRDLLPLWSPPTQHLTVFDICVRRLETMTMLWRQWEPESSVWGTEGKDRALVCFLFLLLLTANVDLQINS